MTIEARSVNIRRGGKSIVTEADVTIEAGTMTALVGPNGAGKSTLLRALAGEFRPDGGVILLDNEPMARFSPIELARTRAVMAQSTPVMFDFTVEEILSLGWVESQFKTSDQYRAARREIVTDCRIEPLLARTFRTLSGGEQQRVQFARCLLQVWQPADEQEPRYLLLDEPTSSLDVAHELKVLSLARARSRAHAGVLLVLHNLNLAARFCDRVVLMFDGRVVESGEPESVFGDELLSNVYATPIRVEWHDALERIIVHT